MQESNARSFIKGISWRIVGTTDTITISYFVTGNVTKALSIGAAEIVTKLILFYLHERAWIYFTKGHMYTRFRSLLKAVTWRLTGTMDTIFMSYLIISLGKKGKEIANPFFKASTIGLIELFTKIVLFYIHERIWLRINYGKSEKKV